MVTQVCHGMIEVHQDVIPINRSMQFIAYFPLNVEQDIMSHVDYLMGMFAAYDRTRFLEVRDQIFDILLSVAILKLGEEHVEELRGSPKEMEGFFEPYEELLNEAIYIYLALVDESAYNNDQNGEYDDMCEEFYIAIGESIFSLSSYIDNNCKDLVSTLFDLPFFTTDVQGYQLQVMNLSLLERHGDFVRFEVVY